MHYSPHSVATNGWSQSNSSALRNSKLVRSAGIWKSNPWWQLRRKNPWNSNLCSENFQQSMPSRYRSNVSIFIFRLDKNAPTSGICWQWKSHHHQVHMHESKIHQAIRQMKSEFDDPRQLRCFSVAEAKDKSPVGKASTSNNESASIEVKLGLSSN